MAVLSCNKCDKTFTQADGLSRHKCSHTQANMVTSELCGKPYRNYNLKRHKESCQKVEISCNLWVKKLKPRSMKSHIETVTLLDKMMKMKTILG